MAGKVLVSKSALAGIVKSARLAAATARALPHFAKLDGLRFGISPRDARTTRADLRDGEVGEVLRTVKLRLEVLILMEEAHCMVEEKGWAKDV